jgi:type I restriction enzyme S subunit
MVGIASAATHAYRAKGITLLRNQNIKNGYLQDDDLLYIDEGYEAAFKNKRLQCGDLVTARTGYPGLTCVIPAQYEGAQSFTTLITRPQKGAIDAQYLCYYINSEHGQAFFEKNQIGGGQKNVNAGALKLMPVPVPSSSEQRAIAETLSDVDALINSLDKLIAKKRDIKQAAMQQLLTGKTRLPGFSGEWSVKRLGDIAEIHMGRTPSRSNLSYWGRGHKWLSIADMKSKRILETKEEITELASLSMTIIPTGTLVMSFKLTIGKLAFVDCDMYSNEAICSFTKLKADNEFMYYVLSRADFSIYGKQAVKGYTLNAESLGSVEVPYPSIPEQRAIASVLSDIDAEIAALEQKRDKTKLLKQGMMQELLTGHIRLI